MLPAGGVKAQRPSQVCPTETDFSSHRILKDKPGLVSISPPPPGEHQILFKDHNHLFIRRSFSYEKLATITAVFRAEGGGLR